MRNSGTNGARANLRMIRGLPGLLYILIGVILVVIGVLGGTNWPGRVAWASGALALAAIAVYLLSSPLYDSVATAL